jgi:LuxR family maltose regulon positive regulatory protein
VASERASRALTSVRAFDAADHVEAIDALLAQLGVAVERDDLGATPPILESLHEICEQFPAFTYRLLVALDEVRIVRARSGLDDALATVAELRAWFDDRARPALQCRLDALEARLLIDAGELGRADVLLGRLPTATPSTRALLEARRLLGAGDATATRIALGRLEVGNVREQIDAAILDARAAVLLGDDFDAALARVVDLAAPERFVRVLREEDAAFTALVRRAAEASTAFGADRLGAALGAPPRRRQPTTMSIELSDRERDVLRFLPTRLTNAEIASECLMSVNTVKAHLKKIYSKLAVTTRAQAVERARVLGELPSPSFGRVRALDHIELSGAQS